MTAEQSVKVVTDSACDLAPVEVSQHGVSVVGLSVSFGSLVIDDSSQLDPQEFWKLVRTRPEFPKTAAPSPEAFAREFQEAKDAGFSGVVCICLSSKLSATYSAALKAAEALEPYPVRVLDSRTVTYAEGMVVLEAANAARQGGAVEDVLARAQEAARRVGLVGMVDDLGHLQRGGRIGKATALMGSLLSTKPLITVRDGEVHPLGKQRTKGKALAALVDHVAGITGLEEVAVLHADCEADAMALAEQAESRLNMQASLHYIGPVIGSHVGPGAIGLVFRTTSALE
jgi:DegV family protein with EDD domain